MPTDPAGNYSLPPGYFAQAGTSIRTEQHNPIFEDVAQGLSQRLMRDGRNGMVGPLDMGTFPIRNIQPGTAPSDAATVSQGIPIGSILDYAGPFAPSGWLFCYGQAVSRTTYASLFEAIGGIYGGGDGSTTFNLPDLRGRVTAGKDDMGGTSANRLAGFFGSIATILAGTLGAAAHVLTVSETPPHQHSGTTGPAGGHSENITLPFSGTLSSGAAVLLGPQVGTTSFPQTATADHTHPFTTGSVGGGAAHSNAQPSLIVNKIIKVSF